MRPEGGLRGMRPPGPTTKQPPYGAAGADRRGDAAERDRPEGDAAVATARVTATAPPWGGHGETAMEQAARNSRRKSQADRTKLRTKSCPGPNHAPDQIMPGTGSGPGSDDRQPGRPPGLESTDQIGRPVQPQLLERGCRQT